MSPEHGSTAMVNTRSFVEHLSRSLTTFQSSSHNAFSVLFTIPRGQRHQPQPQHPSQPPRRLVVLDSSFNPPTTAHADMVRSAVAAAATDGSGSAGARVLLLLAVNNADKAPKPASFPLRLAMMEAFGQDLLRQKGMNGSEGVEIDVGVTTMPYFHDKAAAIVKSGFYGAETESPEMTFLAGFDTLIRIFNPKYYGDEGMHAALSPFFERSRLRVTMRTDGDWGGREEQEQYLRRLGDEGELEKVGGLASWATRVDMVEGLSEVDTSQSAGAAISSSTVRDAVKREDVDVVRKMVGDEVMAWIEREGLYKD